MNEDSLLDAAPAILEASSEAIVTIDNDGFIRGCNGQFLLLLDISDESEIKTSISTFFKDYDFSSQDVDNSDGFEPTKLSKPDGTTSWVLLKVIPFGQQNTGYKTVLIQDPDTIRRIIDRLDFIENYDISTGLANRHKGIIEFEHFQTGDLEGGCLLIKIKIHPYDDGDDSRYGEILKEMSSQLDFISDKTISARYSGSELLFVFASDEALSAQSFSTIVQQLKECPLVTKDIEVSLSYHDWSGTKEDIHTIIANLRSTSENINTPKLIEHFRSQYRTSTRQAFLITLEEALDRNQLDFFIQPQINSENRQVLGGELLIRWLPTPTEVIPPSQFVEFLEDGEFGKTFLQWSITRSADILQQIKDALGYWVPLSLNVSSPYFSQELLVDPLISCFTKKDIPFDQLEIEITERVLAENPKDVLHTLSQLQDNGFASAIDDFGTGYSSLSYLRQFPLNRLKIDRVFVTNLADNEEDRLITVAIASLAHVLGLEVVAEGVETTTQASFLKNIGCEYFQGYLTGKPMPVADFIQFCQDNTDVRNQIHVDNTAFIDSKLNRKHRKVNWKKSFSTDIVSLDNDHQELIDLINKLTDNFIEDPDSIDLCDALDHIGIETLKHFDHEETVMRNINYPRYAIHREKHKWLIADLSKRKLELSINPQAASFEEILQYLKYWLLRHLISEDTHIQRYLNKPNSERRI